MNSFVYSLIGKGKQKKVNLMGQLFDCDWDTFFMSKPRVLVAKDEDVARFEMGMMLGAKWSGFYILERKII